jgi:hypothetical protein
LPDILYQFDRESEGIERDGGVGQGPGGNHGAISAFVTDATDLVIDINGYFVPSTNTSALEFYPITPCRIADTRNANAPLGGPALVALGTRTFPILSSTCGVPATAQA